jgi:hypothetical protein
MFFFLTAEDAEGAEKENRRDRENGFSLILLSGDFSLPISIPNRFLECLRAKLAERASDFLPDPKRAIDCLQSLHR